MDAAEMFLRTILELEEETGLSPKRPALAARLDVSRSAVSQRVARLVDDDLVALGPQKRLSLTSEGRAAASVVMRRHRLVECLLIDVLGLPWEDAHDEATQWQHVLGLRAERRIFELLGRPTVSPFGTPIPGLDELVPRRAQPPAVRGTSLADLAGAGVTRVRLLRIPEALQNDRELLLGLRSGDIAIGTTVDVVSIAPGLAVRGPATEVEVHIPQAVASSICAQGLDRSSPAEGPPRSWSDAIAADLNAAGGASARGRPAATSARAGRSRPR